VGAGGGGGGGGGRNTKMTAENANNWLHKART